ncbi:MAG: arsenosugar biosynthesis radical SAM (seleno)protein ArsS [Desulfovibrionaceae bacterium]
MGTVLMPPEGVTPFSQTLDRNGLSLCRAATHTLQVNVGYLCNLACRHCHLEAGPARKEIMTRATMDAIIAHARGAGSPGSPGYQVADITGGAPEMVPDLPYLVENLAPLVQACMVRSNLVALSEAARRALLDLFVAHKVIIVASFPSVNEGQADAQRGTGVWRTSTAMLKRLNAAGYGMEGTGLELHLVSNPTGAFMPPGQAGAEAKFKRDLMRRCGVSFNRLFTFANVPLGRFRAWLIQSGNYADYLKKLVDAFNGCTIDGLMCRSLLSVAWDGTLYDCDFNLAAGLPLSGKRLHIADLDGPPAPGMRIATGDYCYACTAGSGFT